MACEPHLEANPLSEEPIYAATEGLEQISESSAAHGRDIAQILAEYTAESGHLKVLWRRALALMVGSILPLGALSWFLAFTQPSLFFIGPALQMVVPLALCAVMMRLVWPSPRQVALADELASCGDVRAVIPLMNTLGTGPKELRRAALSKLISLLEQVREEDASLFTDEQIRGFCFILNAKNSPVYRKVMGTDYYGGMVVALLHAVARIGDSRALEPVQRLATKKRVESETEARVRGAAEECLPLLQARVDRQKARPNLLSASDPPASELLRAAEEGRVPDPDSLLRATGP